MLAESGRNETHAQRTFVPAVRTRSQPVLQRLDLEFALGGERARTGQLLRRRGVFHQHGERRDARGVGIDAGDKVPRQRRQRAPVAQAPVQIRQLRQRREMIRHQRQARLECAHRRGEAAFLVLAEAELVLVLRVRRRQSRGLAPRRHGAGLARRVEHVAEHEVCVRPMRRQLDRTLRARLGATELAHGKQGRGLVDPGARVIRALRDRLGKAFGRAVIVAARIEQAAEVVQGRGVVRRQGQRMAQGALGLAEFALCRMQAGQVAPVLDRLRREFQGLVQRTPRDVEFALLQGANARQSP